MNWCAELNNYKIGDEIEISKSNSHGRGVNAQLKRNNYIETIVDISYESGNRVYFRKRESIDDRFEIMDL